MTNGAKKPGARKSAAKRSPAKRAASRKPAGAAAGLGRRVRAWCDAEEHLSVSGERKDDELDLAMQIDASGAQYGRAEVRMARGADRVSIVRAWALAPGTSSEQETSLLSRVGKSVGRLPGLIRYQVRRGGTWPVLEMEATVYLDGLSQHTFMSVLDDLMQAAAVVQPQVERAGGRDALTAAPADQAVGATTQQAPQAPPAAAVAFAPTHRVPRSGLPAWAAPDPNGQVVAQLQGGVELQVLEERGAWAHVLGSNGWKGWVDARQLKKLG